MNKFTKVFENEQLKQYKVAVKMVVESVEIEGSFLVSDKTLSQATEQAMSFIGKNGQLQFVNISKV